MTAIMLSPMLVAILQNNHSQDKSVTCILVNWNRYGETIACLEALRATAYSALNVLVVDNGSNDDSVDRIRTSYPNVEVIETRRNLGFAAGCNRGIRQAVKSGADYLWLLNNDTQPDACALQHMVSVAEADPRIGAVGSVLYRKDRPEDVQCWGGGVINCWLGYSREAKSPRFVDRLDYLTAASVLVPVRAFEDIGLLDERYFLYWEDADFSFRLKRHGWKLGVAGEAMVHHENGASTARDRAARDRYVTTSGIRFLFTYSLAPWLSVPLFVGGRILKRTLKCQVGNLTAVLNGVWDFVQSPSIQGAVRQS